MRRCLSRHASRSHACAAYVATLLGWAIHSSTTDACATFPRLIATTADRGAAGAGRGRGRRGHDSARDCSRRARGVVVGLLAPGHISRPWMNDTWMRSSSVAAAATRSLRGCPAWCRGIIQRQKQRPSAHSGEPHNSRCRGTSCRRRPSHHRASGLGGRAGPASSRLGLGVGGDRRQRPRRACGSTRPRGRAWAGSAGGGRGVARLGHHA